MDWTDLIDDMKNEVRRKLPHISVVMLSETCEAEHEAFLRVPKIASSAVDLFLSAIAIGSTHLLDYLCERTPQFIRVDGHAEKLLQFAATCGHIHVLQYLIDSYDLQLSSSLYRYATAEDHVDVLRYLHEHGVSIDDVSFSVASSHGRADALEYLFQISNPNYLHQYLVVSCAAAGGHTHVLEVLERHMGPIVLMSPYLFDRAADNGHLHFIAYLRKRGLPWTAMACLKAAQSGHIDIVRFALEDDAPHLPSSLIFAAFSNGHLELIKLLHEKNFSILTAENMALAARQGRDDIVKFMYELASLSDVKVVNAARETTNFEFLEPFGM